MKRFLVIALFLSYSLASFGLCIHFDYCCGELEGVSFGAPYEKEKEQQDESSSCCQDKTLSFKKIEDKQVLAESNVNMPTAKVLIPVLTIIKTFSLPVCCSFDKQSKVTYEKPPPALAVSRRVLFGVFRI